jgi:hypothetical protein
VYPSPRLERQNRTRGLVIDGHTCKPRSLGDSLDYDLAWRVYAPPPRRHLTKPFWNGNFANP